MGTVILQVDRVQFAAIDPSLAEEFGTCGPRLLETWRKVHQEMVRLVNIYGRINSKLCERLTSGDKRIDDQFLRSLISHDQINIEENFAIREEFALMDLNTHRMVLNGAARRYGVLLGQVAEQYVAFRNAYQRLHLKQIELIGQLVDNARLLARFPDDTQAHIRRVQLQIAIGETVSLEAISHEEKKV